MRSGRHLLETVGERLPGMFVDFVFAVVWVTVVTVVFDLLPGGPQWLYYLTMLGGVVAYFGFFASLDAVRDESGE